MAADTDVLPRAEPATRLGGYPLNLDRSVVEISLRLLGFSLLRVRLRATAGELTISEPATGVLDLELAGAPLRANLPMARRALCRVIPGRIRLAVALPEIDLSVAGFPVRVDGTVHVRRPGESVRWPLRLVLRAIPTEDEVVVLAVSGRVARPRKRAQTPMFLSVLRAWMHVEAAVEFARCPS